jgi:hypothetical protein
VISIAVIMSINIPSPVLPESVLSRSNAIDSPSLYLGAGGAGVSILIF